VSRAARGVALVAGPGSPAERELWQGYLAEQGHAQT